MQEKIYYSASVIFSALALLLLIADIAVTNGNHKLQNQIGERQEIINRGVNLGQINQSLVQGLADLSSNNNDAEIKALLKSQGITFKPAPKAAVTKTDAESEPKAKSK